MFSKRPVRRIVDYLTLRQLSRSTVGLPLSANIRNCSAERLRAQPTLLAHGNPTGGGLVQRTQNRRHTIAGAFLITICGIGGFRFMTFAKPSMGQINEGISTTDVTEDTDTLIPPNQNEKSFNRSQDKPKTTQQLSHRSTDPLITGLSKTDTAARVLSEPTEWTGKDTWRRELTVGAIRVGVNFTMDC
ncbi:hypothetical protein SpCBS45565_g03843 [Spizellomyces sp. 'palustris']|nr:hypothetical protein SpCBS45565_g03843 [Spizellomyces sp. 'palustris']